MKIIDNELDSEKEKFYQLMKESNNTRLKKWYKLNDLVGLKNISYKSLKNMVKPIYDKHSKTGLIYKRKGRYFISYKILDEFSLKQPRKCSELNWYSNNWEANISYTTKDKYDLNYHEEIIKQIKSATLTVKYLVAIEADKSGRLHVHMLADCAPELIKTTLTNLLKHYLEEDFNLYCEPVQLKGASVDYLIKNPQKLIT
ncbi:hypothetical protein BC962_1157 [Gillisia mitskevichiae]|uniref:Uncharacterized protein n=1 Tax=Gillisia mitskevichiae TaxID=270921 RepID=A0A495Q076_9FLAO|nr:hypothetical protein [Gillisia mitskevichiae]RKS56177.1 hypothetical protein BC962_1157 [Gillisia mitskevichiae]